MAVIGSQDHGHAIEQPRKLRIEAAMRGVDRLLEGETLGGAPGRHERKRLVVILRAADAVDVKHAASDKSPGFDRQLAPIGAVHLDRCAVAAILGISGAPYRRMPVGDAASDREESGVVVAIGARIEGTAYFGTDHIHAGRVYTLIGAAR